MSPGTGKTVIEDGLSREFFDRKIAEAFSGIECAGDLKDFLEKNELLDSTKIIINDEKKLKNEMDPIKLGEQFERNSQNYKNIVKGEFFKRDNNVHLAVYAEKIDQYFIDTLDVYKRQGDRITVYYAGARDIDGRMFDEVEKRGGQLISSQDLSFHDAVALATKRNGNGNNVIETVPMKQVRVIAPIGKLNEIPGQSDDYCSLPIMFSSSDKDGKHDDKLSRLLIPIVFLKPEEYEKSEILVRSYKEFFYYHIERRILEDNDLIGMLVDMLNGAVSRISRQVEFERAA